MLKPRMHRTGAALVGVCSAVLTVPAIAATYQVGPTRQYKTLGAVADLVGPGDVVEVDGGQQYAGGVRFETSGTPTAKITVRGLRVGGSRPVLSGGTNTVEIYANHYVFEGFDLTGGSSRCFYHHGNDITVRDCVIHDCPKQGLLGADGESGSLLLEYTEFHHCGGGTQDHQIYMATDETTYPGSVFRMQYCWVHDGNGGNNVKSRAERNEIYYNWIQGALYHEVELIGPDGQDEDLAREDSDVVGNVLVKDNADSFVVRFGGDGTGQTFGRYRFVNNTVLVRPSGGAVFRLFDGIESVEMHNNAFAVLGSGNVNMVRQVEADWSTGAPVVAGSNNWVVSGSTNVPKEWTGTITGSDPGFGDLAALDVRPVESSPLVNTGAAVLAGPAGHEFPSPLAAPVMLPPLHRVEAPGSAAGRPSAGAIDIGAFEYGVGTGGGGVGGNGTGGNGAGGSGTGGRGTGGRGTGGRGTGGRGVAGRGEGGSSGTIVQPPGSGGLLGSGGLNTDVDPVGGSSGSSSGCGCTASGASSSGYEPLLLALLWLLLRGRGRRRPRRV